MGSEIFIGYTWLIRAQKHFLNNKSLRNYSIYTRLFAHAQLFAPIKAILNKTTILIPF